MNANVLMPFIEQLEPLLALAATAASSPSVATSAVSASNKRKAVKRKPTVEANAAADWSIEASLGLAQASGKFSEGVARLRLRELASQFEEWRPWSADKSWTKLTRTTRPCGTGRQWIKETREAAAGTTKASVTVVTRETHRQMHSSHSMSNYVARIRYMTFRPAAAAAAEPDAEAKDGDVKVEQVETVLQRDLVVNRHFRFRLELVAPGVCDLKPSSATALCRVSLWMTSWPQRALPLWRATAGDSKTTALTTTSANGVTLERQTAATSALDQQYIIADKVRDATATFVVLMQDLFVHPRKGLKDETGIIYLSPSTLAIAERLAQIVQRARHNKFSELEVRFGQWTSTVGTTGSSSGSAPRWKASVTRDCFQYFLSHAESLRVKGEMTLATDKWEMTMDAFWPGAVRGTFYRPGAGGVLERKSTFVVKKSIESCTVHVPERDLAFRLALNEELPIANPGSLDRAVAVRYKRRLAYVWLNQYEYSFTIACSGRTKPEATKSPSTYEIEIELLQKGTGGTGGPATGSGGSGGGVSNMLQETRPDNISASMVEKLLDFVSRDHYYSLVLVEDRRSPV